MHSLLRSAFGAAMAASMIAASTASVAAPFPQAPARASAEVTEDEELAGVGWMIVGAVVLIAIVLVIVLSDGDDDLPASP